MTDTLTKKVRLEFAEISRRLRELHLPKVDVVVGIGRGGIVPASLIAHQLELPLQIMRVNFRDDDNTPRAASPRLLQPPEFNFVGQRVLLVDDVSVTGATLNLAREILIGANIITLTCKGKADFVLFPEISSCVVWPWSAQ
jgi:uncharacterized protein